MRSLLILVALGAAALLLGGRPAEAGRRAQFSVEAGRDGFVALGASLGGFGLSLRIGG